MYHNTGFIFRKAWMERLFITHVTLMGFVLEKVDNSPGWVIYDTDKAQQDFILKYADTAWTF